MPSAQSITLLAADLTDSATDEVYSVVDRKEGITTFRYAGSNPIKLASRLQVAVKQPNAGSKYAKVLISFVKPETYVDSETTLIEQNFINRVNIEFMVDKNATTVQVTAATERTLAFLQDASVQQCINNLENFY